MGQRYACLLVTVCLSGCLPAGQDRPPGSPRVVVVSLDAAADWRVDDLLERGVLPSDGAFARMGRLGARADHLEPIAVSMTAAAHVSLFTGAYPERHGVMSNRFLPGGNAISQSVNGFGAKIEAETLWHAAMREGKRAICADVVGADTSTPDRVCTLTLGYGQSVARSAVVELEADGSAGAPAGEAGFEHVRALKEAQGNREPLSYELRPEGTVPLYALAVDRVRDSEERFDAVILDFDRDLSNGFAALLAEGEWASVYLPVEGRKVGAWVRVTSLAEDLSAVSVYLGAPGANRGDPPEYLDLMETELGPWPGGPDNFHWRRGEIDDETWWTQAGRLADYLRDLTLTNLRRDDWDLLMTYLPLLDEAQHEFLLTDSRQADYDAEGGARRKRFEGYIERAYQRADAILVRWMDAAPPGTNFVIVSDHGMVPVHTYVNLNMALESAGFGVTLDDATEVRAYTSGSTANIW